MTEAADLAVDGLAVARLTLLVTTDGITAPVRARVVRVARRRLPEQLADSIEYLSGCNWCVGVWVAAAVAPVRNTREWRAIRYPLAMACIAGAVGGLT